MSIIVAMKKLQINLDIFCFFKKWHKLQKAIFITGVLLLLISIIFVVSEMFIKVNQAHDELTKNSAVPAILKENDIFPSALSIIWRETLTFTVMSNILLGIAFIVYPFYWNNRKSQTFVFWSLTWISITVSVYWMLISWNTAEWNKPHAAARSIFLHAINPITAFIFFYFIKKDFLLTKKALWFNNLFTIGYFFFALIAFFAAEPIVEIAKAQNVEKPYRNVDATIYSFLNFREPFFYRGGNIGIVVVLDIMIILLSIFFPPLFAYLIKFAFRINVLKRKNKTSSLLNKKAETNRIKNE